MVINDELILGDSTFHFQHSGISASGNHEAWSDDAIYWINSNGQTAYPYGHNNDNLNKSQIKRLCSFKDSKNTLIKKESVSSLLGVDNTDAVETLLIQHMN